MCGFIGIKNFNSFHFNKFTNEIDQVAKLISHRGPDSHKKWISNNSDIHLVFNRLSILETSDLGMQPMLSRSKKLVMVFNGEIYNYLELKKKLQNSNINVQTNSDSEVLINSFDSFGVEKTINFIEGMFAIVLFNLEDNSAYLIRDRMGKKPLYWSIFNDTLFFSSQVKSIKKFNNFETSINFESLNNYFKYGYINNKETIFSNIKKIEPGTYLKISNDKKIEINKYWSLNKINKFEKFNENEAYDYFKHSLINSVKIRTRSDVPIGSFLSGGLDSSVIATILGKFLKTNATFYTAGFEEDEFNENDQAKILSKKLGLNHKNIFVTSKDCINTIDEIPKFFDEPFSDFSSLPSLAISKLTSNDLKVVLTGDGGDEVFGGYNRYKASLYYNRYSYLFKSPLFKSLLKLISNQNPNTIDLLQNLLPKNLRTQFLYDKLNKFHNILNCNNDLDFYKNTLYSWGEESKKCFKNENILDNDIIFNLDLSKKSSLSNLQYLDINNYLLNDILVKIDRSTMAYGLEARSPFLDHKLVEFGYSISDNLKIKKNKTKYLLRLFLKENMPDINFDRPKKGFSFPLHTWLRKDLKSWGESIIYENKIDFINKDVIIKKWEEHQKGSRNWHYQIWTYLMFVKWYEKWI